MATQKPKQIETAIQNLMDVLEGEVTSRTEHFDNKSEKWQEGDRGQEYSDKTDRMQEMIDELSDWQEELEL